MRRSALGTLVLACALGCGDADEGVDVGRSIDVVAHGDQLAVAYQNCDGDDG